MATLQTKSFNTLVSDQAAAIQGGTPKYLVDMSVGSILRAVTESFAAVVMWLQGLVLQLLSATRAATSISVDLDSWMLDFGLTRLPARSSTGNLTFARFTASAQAVVPIGAVAQSADGLLQYTVTLDAANSAYSATLGGYVLAISTASVIVPAMAISSGAATNAVAGAVNTLGQAIVGIDTVTNAAAFISGSDAEIDAALRARFVNYVSSLSKATKGAVTYAVTNLGASMTLVITENYTYGGVYQPGYFYVVFDDGSGAPTMALQTTVTNAIDAVRPVGSTFAVFAPVVVTANISLIITTAAGYDHLAATVAVNAAIKAYVNALGIGGTLAWTKLVQLAYDATPGITNVGTVLINSVNADLAITNQQVCKAGTVVIS